MIALIPCRGGSKRVPNKNFRMLGSKPLVTWTIDAAHEAGLEDIYLCTDDPAKALDASTYSQAPDVHVLHQPHPLHRDDCTDHEWISDALDKIREEDHLKGFCGPCSLEVDHMAGREFILLRPTSPFRGPETIKRALEQWEACKEHLDSLRSVREATEPAWKQWQRWPGTEGNLLVPCAWNRREEHWHSRPTQSLPQCYIQTAALEIAWCRTILGGTLSGERVGMFLTEGAEALDINTPEDWERAEELAATSRVTPEPLTELRQEAELILTKWDQRQHRAAEWDYWDAHAAIHRLVAIIREVHQGRVTLCEHEKWELSDGCHHIRCERCGLWIGPGFRCKKSTGQHVEWRGVGLGWRYVQAALDNTCPYCKKVHPPTTPCMSYFTRFVDLTDDFS